MASYGQPPDANVAVCHADQSASNERFGKPQQYFGQVAIHS